MKVIKNIAIKDTIFLLLIKVKCFRRIYDKRNTYCYRYIDNRINEILFTYVKNIVIKDNSNLYFEKLRLMKIYNNCRKIKKELSFNDFRQLLYIYIKVYKN